MPCNSKNIGIRLVAIGAIGLGMIGSVLAEQKFPARPVTIVTGYAAGAASDTLARALAEELQARWGQPVIVENRPGSGGNIAAAQGRERRQTGTRSWSRLTPR